MSEPLPLFVTTFYPEDHCYLFYVHGCRCLDHGPYEVLWRLYVRHRGHGLSLYDRFSPWGWEGRPSPLFSLETSRRARLWRLRVSAHCLPVPEWELSRIAPGDRTDN